VNRRVGGAQNRSERGREKKYPCLGNESPIVKPLANHYIELFQFISVLEILIMIYLRGD
jgi:hypothetical protein